jgi:hypothetical protein
MVPDFTPGLGRNRNLTPAVLAVKMREFRALVNFTFSLTPHISAVMGRPQCDLNRFASKVMGHIRFGFAAGCAAVAMPPPAAARLFPGYAPGRA